MSVWTHFKQDTWVQGWKTRRNNDSTTTTLTVVVDFHQHRSGRAPCGDAAADEHSVAVGDVAGTGEIALLVNAPRIGLVRGQATQRPFHVDHGRHRAVVVRFEGEVGTGRLDIFRFHGTFQMNDAWGGEQ